MLRAKKIITFLRSKSSLNWTNDIYSYLVRLDDVFFAWIFVYFLTLYAQAAKALVIVLMRKLDFWSWDVEYLVIQSNCLHPLCGQLNCYKSDTPETHDWAST